MKHRIAMLTAAAFLAIPVAASAQAHDCAPNGNRGHSECVRAKDDAPAQRGHAQQQAKAKAPEKKADHPKVTVGKVMDRDYPKVTDHARYKLPKPGPNTEYRQINDLIVAIDKTSHTITRILRDLS